MDPVAGLVNELVSGVMMAGGVVVVIAVLAVLSLCLRRE